MLKKALIIYIQTYIYTSPTVHLAFPVKANDISVASNRHQRIHLSNQDY